MPNKLGLLPIHVKKFKEVQSTCEFAIANPIDKVYHAFEGGVPGVAPIDVLAMNTLLRTYAHLRWHREGRADEKHLRHIVGQWAKFYKSQETEATGHLQEYKDMSRVERVFEENGEDDGGGRLLLADCDAQDLKEDDDYDDGLSTLFEN